MATTAKRTTFPLLDPVNDLRHDVVHRPKARESLAYMMQMPDEGIFVTVYTWISTEGLVGRAVSAAGPGVGETVLEYVEGVAGGADQNFDNWSVAGVTLKHVELLQKAIIQYEGDEMAVDLVFDALHPAFAHSSQPQRKGHTTFVADDRLEQSGRVTGTVTVRGKLYPVDTWLHRDHSWGVRDWSQIQHHKWFSAEAPGVNIYFFNIFGHGETWLYGYVDRDGLMARVTDAIIDVEYDDEMYGQRSAHIELEDDAGRTTIIDAETYAIVAFPVDENSKLHEAGMRTVIDGAAGVGHLGILWPIKYVDNLVAAKHCVKQEPQ